MTKSETGEPAESEMATTPEAETDEIERLSAEASEKAQEGKDTGTETAPVGSEIEDDTEDSESAAESDESPGEDGAEGPDEQEEPESAGDGNSGDENTNANNEPTLKIVITMRGDPDRSGGATA